MEETMQHKYPKIKSKVSMNHNINMRVSNSTLFFIFVIFSLSSINSIKSKTHLSNYLTVNTSNINSKSNTIQELPISRDSMSIKQNNNNVNNNYNTIGNTKQSIDNTLTEQNKIYDNSEEAKINNIKSTIYIDPVELSCDIKYLEKTSFSFTPATNVIYYTVISPRNPYYNFKAELSEINQLGKNVDIEITNVEVYMDKSFKERIFVDQYNNNIIFRDRWVIVTTLNKTVSEVSIDYTYFSERSILISKNQESDMIKLTIFNPYNQVLPYDIDIRLTGFSSLDTGKLKLPFDSSLREFTYKRGNSVLDNGIEISTKKNIEPFTQYEMFLSLPMEIKSCDAGFINIVYYSLIGLTGVFIIASLLTIFNIYKE